MTAKAINWDDSAERHGVRVYAAFHSARAVASLPAARQELPMLLGTPPVQLSISGERLRLGYWRADPDGLYEMGSGWIVLTRCGATEEHTPDRWQEQFDTRNMWRALANAMAVSATMEHPTIAIARAPGAAYLLSPSQDAVARIIVAAADEHLSRTAGDLERACAL